jgi:hypothetical protein
MAVNVNNECRKRGRWRHKSRLRLPRGLHARLGLGDDMEIFTSRGFDTDGSSPFAKYGFMPRKVSIMIEISIEHTVSFTTASKELSYRNLSPLNRSQEYCEKSRRELSSPQSQIVETFLHCPAPYKAETT